MVCLIRQGAPKEANKNDVKPQRTSHDNYGSTEHRHLKKRSHARVPTIPFHRPSVCSGRRDPRVPGGRGREATLTRLVPDRSSIWALSPNNSYGDCGTFLGGVQAFSEKGRGFSSLRSRSLGWRIDFPVFSHLQNKDTGVSAKQKRRCGVCERGEPCGSFKWLLVMSQPPEDPNSLNLTMWSCTPLRGRERRLAPCREVRWCERTLHTVSCGGVGQQGQRDRAGRGHLGSGSA